MNDHVFHANQVEAVKVPDRHAVQGIPASVVTFRSKDGSKLNLAANEKVEVFRIELIFDDDTKVTLWKLAAEIR